MAPHSRLHLLVADDSARKMRSSVSKKESLCQPWAYSTTYYYY